VLVVGVDSDQAIKKYKGPLRPIIPEDERREMLCYLSCVDFVTTLDDVDETGRWQFGLIKILKPTIFVAVEGSYPPAQCREIRRHSEKLVILPRQAEKTSSTAIIQGIIKTSPDLARSFAEVKS
jgi:D-glycero-beta-D-manno-heptose 1-phosphate adenylyltransferase